MTRFQATFGALILAQAAHSVEEYVGRLWESFPPARFLTGLVSQDLERGFVVINVSRVATAVGNAANRSLYYQVEDTRHYLNINALLVGRTSKARKGTSWARTRAVLERIDDTWIRSCIAGGLSSGEGLIWRVLDPIMKTVRVRQCGDPRLRPNDTAHQLWATCPPIRILRSAVRRRLSGESGAWSAPRPTAAAPVRRQPAGLLPRPGDKDHGPQITELGQRDDRVVVWP